MSAPMFCRFCNAENSIDEIGRVSAGAWRKVESVSRGEDGKLKPALGHVEHDYPDTHDFDRDGYRCSECQREENRLEDLVGDPLALAPGALVICPDGFRGTVATIDEVARTLTVEGWHEVFKFSEVDPLRPPAARLAA